MIESPYDPLPEILLPYFNQQEMVKSRAQKAVEIAEAADWGYHRGTVTAVTALLNEERTNHYEKVSGFMSGLDSGPVSRILTERKREFRAVRTAPDMTNEDAATVLKATVEDLRALIPDEGLDTRLEQARRQRILAGEEEPVPDDVTWIREEQERLAAQANPLAKVLGKLGG
jgi:hypothetical protein